MLYLFAALGGIAGLTWELLWMHYTALSLGVSARGAALTLVAFSVGMGAGAFAAGRWLEGRRVDRLRVWGALEIGIGLLGQLLAPGFSLMARWDAQLYATSPHATPILHGLGVLLLLAVPSACMGATIPVFASLAREFRLSLSLMYASNIAGASVGIVLASFVLIPAGGIEATVGLASSIGLALGAAMLVGAMRRSKKREPAPPEPARDASVALRPRTALIVVAATGFATFCLEVAWFRSLRAAFQATTESFALVMFAVLLALAGGGSLARRQLRGGRVSLGIILTMAAVAVLVTTPVVERLDRVVLAMPAADSYTSFVLRRLAVSVAVLGPAMLLIGVGLPYCLEAVGDARRVGQLYAVNTAASVVGSLACAWLLLPTIGSAYTAWVAALVLAFAAWATLDPSGRLRPTLAIVAAVVVASIAALGFGSHVGELRVQTNRDVEHEVLETHEGPDATVSVIEHADGSRHLVIDGFYATGTDVGAHYMPWMGHLPMLMHPQPDRALVICFGTGQTANAVLEEQPRRLDIVDVNASVFAMADRFPENHGVLDDPRVFPHAMDGRAWLRRSADRYDVVTLEPMPPTFAGTNALYSVEFYRLVERRLAAGGIVAQWLPFHLVDPPESAAIVGAFIEVFPEAFLWLDPTGTGILIGRASGSAGMPLWPGLERPVQRDMTSEQIRRAMRYGPRLLAAYAGLSEPVTDDDQRLSYGFGRTQWWGQGVAETIRYQHLLLEAIAQGGPVEENVRAFMTRYPTPRSLPR